MMSTVEALIIPLVFLLIQVESAPNIVFILADDLGWNDVGFHGSGEIPTPNIDALAYSGLILNNYYVAPICTPSRSALMTGKHPIHTGMQHGVLYGEEPRGLPLTEKLLPEYLNELGYTSHIVGKWHLGSYKKEYTPLYRGFKSHLGIWTGHHDQNDHTAEESGTWGLDMRRNMDVAWDLHGKYSTDVFTNEAVKIINEHNKTSPLFLYIAHVAVHSGNPYNPIAAPDGIVAQFSNISNYNRRRFAGTLHKLDESIGTVVKALSDQKMLENTIIVFSTDNGGPAAGFNLNAASNSPLRGVKNTLWEGGVRGASFIWSWSLKKPKRVSTQLMHVSDWLPTLYSAAGGDVSIFKNIDGVDLWSSLSEDMASPRKTVLHNIDDIFGNAAVLYGEWKLLKGTTYDGIWDSWYGPSGRNLSYNVDLVLTSDSGKALSAVGSLATPQEMLSMRSEAEVVCPNLTQIKCEPLVSSCLFNIKEDPCEVRNLASINTTKLLQMETLLSEFNKTAVSPGNLPLDRRGDPKYWDYTWTNFGDYIIEATTRKSGPFVYVF